MKVVARFILTLVCLVFVLYLVDVRAVFSVSGKSSQVMPQLLQALLAVFIPMALMIVWVFVSYWLRVRRVAQLHQALIERRATGDVQR